MTASTTSNKIRSVCLEAEGSIDACTSVDQLAALRNALLGKNGVLSAEMRGISSIVDLDSRREVGALANELSRQLRAHIDRKMALLARTELNSKLIRDKIDVTLPGRLGRVRGVLHPTSKVILEIKRILTRHGFSLVEGPDMEDEFHVFDALNTPAHHPARDKNDTFYMSSELQGRKVVLRTHTSSVQIRTMETNRSYPIKIISAGKVYRNDWDASHSPMFHQVEGLYIDKAVNMGHLKRCINDFLNEFFCGCDIEIRMRASFFPFTEPSAEVDIRHAGGRWIEVLGCGMVHHKVLENVNIDPTEYSGFAFGLGVERMAMVKYCIDDLRQLYSNRLDWLNHYGFCFTSIIE